MVRHLEVEQGPTVPIEQCFRDPVRLVSAGRVVAARIAQVGDPDLPGPNLNEADVLPQRAGDRRGPPTSARLLDHVQDESGRGLVALQVRRIKEDDGSGPAERGIGRVRADARAEGEDRVAGRLVREHAVVFHLLRGRASGPGPVPRGDRRVHRVRVQVVVRVRDFREEIEAQLRLDRIDRVGRPDPVRPFVDEDRGPRALGCVHGCRPHDLALRGVHDRNGDCVRGPECWGVVVPPLANVPDAVRAVQQSVPEHLAVLVECEDRGRRRIRPPL